MTGTAVGGSGGARCALALAAVFLAVPPVWARPGAATSGTPVVQVARGVNGLEVEGRCLVRASRAQAWEVLTDYDGIDRFVSSMVESRISGQGPGYLLVDQVAVGGLFLFRKRLHATLWVLELPPGRIQFVDVLNRDFVQYRGEWRIAERGDQVEIVYQVAALPRFSVPDFVARGMFRKTVRDLLAEVTAEIVRRADLARGAAPLKALPTADVEDALAGAR